MASTRRRTRASSPSISICSKAGGSKHHSELLAPFGLDASKPEFWQKGLKVIEGMIDELERADAAA